jgi:hypothetical protein
VESERNGNGVGPDEGCGKRIGAGWRLKRIGAEERLGESCRKTVGSVVAVVAVGRLGAELDLEGDLVERYWNRRLVVLEPGGLFCRGRNWILGTVCLLGRRLAVLWGQ